MGIFGRGLWTPDEPREADIAWRMSMQADRTLPVLAGAPFLEKPPLSYWLASGGIRAFGDSAGAARAANLLYGLVTATAVAALALALGVEGPAALLAALAVGSALTAYRVTSWLAPDACLLAGNALALWGLWRGYRAAPGKDKALGYALMHVGAAIGFMAKSAPGWLVPGLAFVVLVGWERRWAELKRIELYAGLLLQALIIGPWLLAVSRGAGGADALRTLFWNNIVGRFTHLNAPAEIDYTSGHRNTPGKYLFELPLYLLPWTLVAAAALVRSVRGVRAGSAEASAWRFSLACALPFLLILSLAATARDIYAAPALIGFALLIALWCRTARTAPTPLDEACLNGTRWLVALLGCGLIAALAVLAAAGATGTVACVLASLAIVAVGVPALRGAARLQKRGEPAQSLIGCYVAFAAALALSALVIFPVVDRWQDLAGLARRIHADTQGEPLALLDPDETTLAMIDHGSVAPFSVLKGAEASAVGRWFSARGTEARVLVLLPGHAPGDLTRWLERWHHTAAPGEGIAGRLVASGTAALVQRYELPQGRRYALLGPPEAANPTPATPD